MLKQQRARNIVVAVGRRREPRRKAKVPLIQDHSALSPLREGYFKWFLLASLVSNVGTWMHDVGASWLMTWLTPSPLPVALIQSSMSLPIFFLSLPAGALADMVDRRRLLVAAQCWMLLGAALLGIITIAGLTGPWLLLGLTLLISLGAALSGPAWHAVVPEFVNRAQLASAITLRALGYNLSRIIGPVLGGWIIAAYVVASKGAGLIFLINALSFCGVVCVLLCCQRVTPRSNHVGPMRLGSAIRAGWLYVVRAATLRAILIRASVFILCESALWATLPFLARHQFKASAIGFAFLMSCMGIGAISGGLVFSSLRRRVSLNRIIVGATIVAAIMLLLLTRVRTLPFACLLVLASGAAWLATITSFNIVLLHSAPDWVRSRAVAIFQFVFFGCSAGGSALWGELASYRGVPTALACSGVGLLIGQLVIWRARVSVSDERPGHDLTR